MKTGIENVEIATQDDDAKKVQQFTVLCSDVAEESWKRDLLCIQCW